MQTFQLTDLKGNIAIVGNRECGKTTLLNKIKQECKNCVSIFRDDDRNLIFENADEKNPFEKEHHFYFLDNVFLPRPTRFFLDKLLEAIMIARHKHNNIIMTCQLLKNIPAQMRENLDFILYMSSQRDLPSVVNAKIAQDCNVLYNVRNNAYLFRPK